MGATFLGENVAMGTNIDYAGVNDDRSGQVVAVWAMIRLPTIRCLMQVSTRADEAKAVAKLTEAAAELSAAAETVNGLLKLAHMTDAAGRTGKRGPQLKRPGGQSEP